MENILKFFKFAKKIPQIKKKLQQMHDPLCSLTVHTFLPSLSPHLLYTGLRNYYLQCRLRKTNSFEKCLQEPFHVFAQLLTLSKLGSFITHTKAKGANLQNNVFAQFPGSPLPVKKPLQMHILLLLLHFGRTNTVAGRGKISEPSTAGTSNLDCRCFEYCQIDRNEFHIRPDFKKIKK